LVDRSTIKTNWKGSVKDMEALYILIPISLALAGGALFSFIWAAKKGQFNDLSSPAERIVLEDFEDK
jgi:cbb3-type cytochrome oxidase maturation protein